ncbi:MAG: hypothetical protein U0R78_17140 [Nocardioidaceae bacterium]
MTRGDAFIRSVAFRQVTYCRDCWESRNASIEVPSQRQPIHDYAAVEGL